MKLAIRTPFIALAAAIFAAGLLPAHAGPVTATSAPTAQDLAVDSGGMDSDRVQVFLRLRDEPAAAVFAGERESFMVNYRFLYPGDRSALVEAAERESARLALQQAAALKGVQRPLMERLVQQFGAEILYSTRHAENGIAAVVPASTIEALRALPGVARVSRLALHEPHAVSSINFTGARTFWGTVAPDLDMRGDGIGVGVIDTGVDHMHTAFGGPGGSNYATGVTTTTPYPDPPGVPVATSFPTPKVVWGFDFAGDSYNAAGTTNAELIPQPDGNAMDTNGHGTAVGSLMAGFGVNNDGTTYVGSHTRTEPNIITQLRISPGYAPQASIYAFRVFGTTGSSAVVTAAVDAATAVYLWQANPMLPWDGSVSVTVRDQGGQPQLVEYNVPQPPQTPRLRVINLSLGSNAGDIEEASAAASQNAAEAGLIVVLSAGNANDTYYITGAPGVAAGGISVAASFNDQFPGGVANAPVNGAQPALVNFQISQLGTAAFAPVENTVASTAAIWARPNRADFTAPVPSGYTPPPAIPPATGDDLAPLVTLLDPDGVAINLFSADGSGNLIVTDNPAANNVYAGRIVLVDRGAVGFHQKALAAQRAGAVAAIIVNSTATFGNMAGNANLPDLGIPSVMVTQAVGGEFADGGGLNTGDDRSVATRPGLFIALSATNQGRQDLMAGYSSRGPRRTDDGIKPDITAPAENVSAADATTGNGVTSFNGTSSAAPHTAGAMTLLHGLHPDWSNFELKALLLNSVSNDIYTTPGPDLFTPPSGQAWGVTRQGAGRWDLNRFSGGGNDVLVFAQDPPDTDGGASRAGTVNVSFGVFDVVDTATIDRTVVVRNKGNVQQGFALSFRNLTETPGVGFSFPDGNAISVPANGETTFTVRVTANADSMRHARDLSLRPFQFINTTALANRVPRQFLNEASGYVDLTPTGGGLLSLPPATHRLTVQAFPRRASALALDDVPDTAGFSATVPFVGSGFNTGPNTAFVDTTTFTVQPSPVDIVSFAKGFEHAFAADPTPGLASSERAGDIAHVGVTSDFGLRGNPFDQATTGNQSTVLVFGIAAHGQFDTVENFGVEYQIDIDSNQDGTTDRMVRQVAFVNGEATNVRTNIMLPTVASAPPFTSSSGTGFFLNVLSNVYTNLYNNSVVMIPVRVSGGTNSLGLTESTAQFRYRVRGVHRGVQISSTPWLTYDVSRPGVVFTGLGEPSLVTPVQTGGALNSLAISTNGDNLGVNGSLGLMMMFPMNAQGERVQTFSIRGTAIFADGFEPASP